MNLGKIHIASEDLNLNQAAYYATFYVKYDSENNFEVKYDVNPKTRKNHSNILLQTTKKYIKTELDNILYSYAWHFRYTIGSRCKNKQDKNRAQIWLTKII